MPPPYFYPGHPRFREPPPELPPTKDQLKVLAANKRYAVEIGGTSINGTAMATDRDTQAKLTGAYLLALENPATSFEWKTPSGFVTLTAELIIIIAVAVGNFVQAAYRAERAVSEAIDAGTITTLEQINAYAWPT